ncbi:hypothetical protein GCM10010345_83920 [Streptomyces canarius]|uniref:Uncharacterized protein n=1 Tax=Streptomyces canarius TaxID=285453 RepID=A0ABQ3DBA6_9ACTN|nr:hypothetical protein GCM10010345_83920 [Streptomyces canarius]
MSAVLADLVAELALGDDGGGVATARLVRRVRTGPADAAALRARERTACRIPRKGRRSNGHFVPNPYQPFPGTCRAGCITVARHRCHRGRT